MEDHFLKRKNIPSLKSQKKENGKRLKKKNYVVVKIPIWLSGLSNR
jgi:hypothetical protein